MKEIGKMIKLMDLENTCTLMVLSMKDSGRKINSMAKVRKHGQMELVIKVTI